MTSEPAGLPTLVVTEGPGGKKQVSVVFGPMPSEPRMCQIGIIPILEEDGGRPLDELAAMLQAGTLRRRT